MELGYPQRLHACLVSDFHPPATYVTILWPANSNHTKETAGPVLVPEHPYLPHYTPMSQDKTQIL